MPRVFYPIKPMLCSPCKDIPKGWFIQPKVDGFRIQIHHSKGRTELYSRNMKNLTERYPEIKLNLPFNCIIDGELVVLDKNGKPNFRLTQEHPSPAVVFAFDILFMGGKETMSLPLEKRLEGLANLFSKYPQERVKFIPTSKDLKFAEKLIAEKWEGVIFKNPRSDYAPDRRLPTWQKLKNTETDDFVVVGYTKGTGLRHKYFGNLVLAKKQRGKFVFCGLVWDGFREPDLKRISKMLRENKTDSINVKNLPDIKINFVVSKIVVEIVFQNRTDFNRLRNPFFLRLREDK